MPFPYTFPYEFERELPFGSMYENCPNTHQGICLSLGILFDSIWSVAVSLPTQTILDYERAFRGGYRGALRGVV